MTTSPHRKTAAQIRQQLRDGKGKMPAFKDILTPADVDNLLAYIRTL
jgi:mono/diheme cytochrome c family protein